MALNPVTQTKYLPHSQACLEFHTYFLNESAARLLGRPAGSPETVLRLYGPSQIRGTPPSASWYIPIATYSLLFDKIQSPADFSLVACALESIVDEDTARTARLRLNEFLRRPY
jgi:hypothetical protein